MFSGIVQEVGRVKAVLPQGKTAFRVEIEAPAMAGALRVGESVSVDGICLTVTALERDRFTVEVMSETRRVTTAERWIAGRMVNLEPPLRVGDPLGGHLVSGHVDGVAPIRRIRPNGTARMVEVALPASLRAWVVPKGSITVDGVSLTVATLDEEAFRVGIIPHTLAVTTLGRKKVGDLVNLELDMIGKFVLRYLEESFLQEGEIPPPRFRAARRRC